MGITIESGHYIAHVKHEDQWYLCNDADVRHTTRDTIKPHDIVILAFKKDRLLLQQSQVLQTETTGEIDTSPALLPLQLGSSLEAMTPGPSKISQFTNPMPKITPHIISKPTCSCKIILVQSDITKLQDIDCIVNAANSELRVGGGVDGAIHKAAGEDLYRYCSTTYRKCNVGQAVISPSFKLKKRFNLLNWET